MSRRLNYRLSDTDKGTFSNTINLHILWGFCVEVYMSHHKWDMMHVIEVPILKN